MNEGASSLYEHWQYPQKDSPKIFKKCISSSCIFPCIGGDQIQMRADSIQTCEAESISSLYDRMFETTSRKGKKVREYIISSSRIVIYHS